MFYISVLRIDARLLSAVERVGKIAHIDEDNHTFNATFNGCKIKVRGTHINIKNPEEHTYLSLSEYDFEEVSIT